MRENEIRPLPVYPLTSLRFFAAAAIVLMHMQRVILPTGKYPPLGLGVSFFFVLSGFILTYVYRDFSGHSIKAFYLARFARLWPVHLVTFLLATVLLLSHPFFEPHRIAIALSNLTLTQAWIPVRGVVFSFNGVSWSISSEVWFYLLFPFLVTTNRLWVWVCGVVGVAAVILLGTQWMGLPLGRSGMFEFSVNHLIMQHPAVRAVEFTVGVLAGRLFISGYRNPFAMRHATLCEVVSIGAVLAFAATSPAVRVVIHHSWGSPQIGLWYSQSGGALVFAVAIYVFAQSAGTVSGLLSRRTFVVLGEISYCTYMIHQIVIGVAHRNHLVDVLGWKASAILTIVFVYLASYLLWRFVEVVARRQILSFKPKITGQGNLASQTAAPE